MKTIPSILEKTTSGLIGNINKLSPYFNHFQIDIADGILVPNKTITIEDFAMIMKRRSIKTTENIVFDFHLMIKDYKTELPKIKSIARIVNVESILIHFGALENSFSLKQWNTGPMKRYELGITLNPEDEVNTIIQKLDLNQIPIVQIMTVNPGYQGSPFIPQMLNKITQLRDLNYRNKIYLDGAINNQTIPQILSQKFRPDVLCPGSFLTKADNLEENAECLKSLT